MTARAVACVLLAVGLGCKAQLGARLAVVEAGTRRVVEASGLGAEAATLRLFVAAKDAPPMLGRAERSGTTLRFVPRFPLEPGLAYRARLEFADGTRIEKRFRLAAPPSGPRARVAGVLPSGDVLPANLLKFYIEFSAPMSQGEAYEHVHLVGARGKRVPDAFLEIGEELWDPDGTRLTLLFDPGRVKRELVPNRELGRALRAGRGYRLVIDADWPDARGRPLARGFVKHFRAAAADTVQPDPARWKLTAPAAGSRGPLVVRFGEPLDAAMLDRVLRVATAAGESVAGEVAVGTGETTWRFTPARPWRRTDHRLRADTTLEDRAGNSIAWPFEVDATRKRREPRVGATVTLPFRPR